MEGRIAALALFCLLLVSSSASKKDVDADVVMELKQGKVEGFVSR